MGKYLPANAGDARDKVFNPWVRRAPGEGNGNPLQRSYLTNSTGRGAWWATDTTEYTHTTLLPYCALGRTRQYSVLLDVSLVVRTHL